jgi:pimeloyl-ACP methyl ester carboxylesterase
LSLWPIVLADYWRAGPWRGWQSLRLALRDPVVQKLPRLRVPTLVVRGRRDSIVPLRWARQLRDLLPHGRLVVLPNAPHAANYSTPDELARVVRAFLDQD